MKVVGRCGRPCQMRNNSRGLTWVSGLALLALTSPVRAERTWVEPPKPAPVESERPDWPADHPVLCSERKPVCVHAKAQPQALEPALHAAENAYTRVVDVLGWRAPRFFLGPHRRFDVYLVPSQETWEVRPDPLLDTSRHTKTSAFGRVALDTLGSCRLPYAMAASVARAGIYALDAAANDELANATAAYVASVAEPCADAFVAEVDDFQANPHLAVSNPAHDGGRGAMLFPWYLQTVLGKGAPADLLHALWALSVQPAPDDPAVLRNEPDFFDTTAILAHDVDRSLPDLLLDFAVARAFVGNRDDGIHMPDSRFLGASGAVRFEWSIPYSSLPRRLAPLHPVEPTGASYVWLTLDDVPEKAGLGFRATWEAPDVFRFALVLVGKDGRAVARHDPVSPERGTTAQLNVEMLHNAAGVLIVACNTGSVLRDIAYDPDNRPLTPRGYEVSLFAQK